MKDFSLCLPSWAVREGYRLEGGLGTFDELYLYKNSRLVRMWDILDEVPSIFEMEEIINEIEGKESSP